MEWPPRSGRRQAFPELDRAAWFEINEAHAKILKGQAVFLDRLLSAIVNGYVCGRSIFMPARADKQEQAHEPIG